MNLTVVPVLLKPKEDEVKLVAPALTNTCLVPAPKLTGNAELPSKGFSRTSVDVADK